MVQIRLEPPRHPSFGRRQSPDDPSATCRWRTRRASRAENKLPDPGTTRRRAGGLIERDLLGRHAPAIHDFERFDQTHRRRRHRYRVIVQAVIPALDDLASIRLVIARFTATGMIVTTGFILTTNRQIAANLQIRQFTMQGERQPKGRQPQRQHSHGKTHGRHARMDPSCCKCLSAGVGNYFFNSIR